MKKWYIELLVNRNGELVNPCGTDYSMIYEDLKTLNGVINRIKKWYPITKLNQEVVSIKIYNYTNFFNKDTHILIFEASKNDYIFKNIVEAQIQNMGN